MVDDEITHSASFRSLSHVEEAADATAARDEILTKTNRTMRNILWFILLVGIGGAFVWRFGFHPPRPDEIIKPPPASIGAACEYCAARVNLTVSAKCPGTEVIPDTFLNTGMIFCPGLATPCCCPPLEPQQLDGTDYSGYHVTCASPMASLSCTCRYNVTSDDIWTNLTYTAYMLLGIVIVLVASCMWCCVWSCRIRQLKKSLP
ncbi:Aste57867_1827 [Aphanomyces stellatus]|uniref:Aste57867_1827 protein n=1 Tax=Aphanomyces stellatus TaxID=120398 RepID=A0A485KAE4_9STRA|nr:hypothetical protein As57867_001825 [Aphanomyces stellatus]VFT79035.1 Aste57867_1827 [Aphanomyces stellatus]